MFHSNTELLIDYWRAQKGDARLPTRADVDPADFAEILPQVFLAGRIEPGTYPIRLAGEFVVDLHGHGLRGENLADLWTSAHRVELQGVLEAALRDPEPVVVSASASSDEGPLLRLEVLFAPLAGVEGKPDRFLGLYQPISPVAALRDRPIRELSIRTVGGADLRLIAPRLRLAAVDGRQIA